MAQTQTGFELSGVPRTRTRMTLDVDTLVPRLDHP
jgi:hypothetical protein